MKNNYTFFGFLHIFFSYVFTKFFYSNSRLIRIPFFVRGKRNISFGNNLTTGVGCRIECYGNDNKKKLIFGNDVQVNDYVHIACVNNLTIGDNVLIASKVYISDHNHGRFDSNFDFNLSPIEWDLDSKPVSIGENSWIGQNVVILPGVNIGEGCIIGANSVVTKNIPSYTVSVGSPSKVIKHYNFKTKLWQKISQ